jgi:DNA-binding response OmpR family regulator
MKILLIEDDETTAATLSKALTTSRYVVNTSADGRTALELAKTYDYDLIILDVMIPGLDGISLCRQLRRENYQVPVLMLTAKSSSHDRVIGLEAGADDYVVKPFDWAELLARIRALLRRKQATSFTEILTWENLQLELNSSTVTYDGQPLHLTKKEYGLLELLLRHPQRIFSRGAILDNLWSPSDSPGEWTVTTHVKELRQKLQTAGMQADLIETVYGLGYRLRPEPSSEPPAASTALPKRSRKQKRNSKLSSKEADVLADVEQIWQAFQTKLAGAIALFEQTIDHFTQGTLDLELRERAQTEAHRLVGSLGTFGLPNGANLAQQLEQSFQTLGQTEAQRLSKLIQALKQAVTEERQLPQSLAPSPPESSTPESAPRRLLVIDDTLERIAQLQTEATNYQLQIDSATSFAIAASKLSSQSVDVVLLNLAITEGNKTGLTFLAELAKHHSQIPVVVLSGTLRSDQFRYRLEVAQLGQYRVLSETTSPDRMLQAVVQSANRMGGLDCKVLVVDDDSCILKAVPKLLEPWGLEVITLQDSQRFWELLETAAPDLLILDIEMPNFSGLDLCKVVRTDDRWGGVPILFLSGHTDAETINQVFNVGADDYVSKPIVAAELVARVLNRLERVKTRRYQPTFKGREQG